MALFRMIQTSFWTDTKVVEDFTLEDTYFYLYLFSNPHTNLIGCYEISKTQMSTESKFSKDSINELIDRFENIHHVILYDTDTREILLKNWHKYNWTKSADLRKALLRELSNVKSIKFKEFLFNIIDSLNTVYAQSKDGGGIANTNTITISNSNYKKNRQKDNDRAAAEEVINSYNELCPSLPRTTKLTDKRNKLINARLKEYSIEEIKEAFRKAEESDFLRNGRDTWNGANLEWILNPNNIVKILEGNYSKKEEANKTEKKESKFRFIENKEQEGYIRGNFEMCQAFYPEDLQDKGDYEAFLNAIDSDNFDAANRKAQIIKMKFMNFKADDYDRPFREKIIS